MGKIPITPEFTSGLPKYICCADEDREEYILYPHGPVYLIKIHLMSKDDEEEDVEDESDVLLESNDDNDNDDEKISKSQVVAEVFKLGPDGPKPLSFEVLTSPVQAIVSGAIEFYLDFQED